MTDELRLLLVDDSEDDARLIERALRRDGLDVAVTRVETEADFRAALAQSRWDAILTDYHLPAFDGLVALRLALSLGRGCPVILVSGAVGEETAVAAMKAGANDYVLKSNLARLGPALRRELVEMTVREERNQAEQALRDSEARLRFVTDHMLDMISEVDALGIMQYASPSHEVILGHPLSALVGESVFQFVHDDDVSAVLEAFQEGFATRSPRTVVYRFRHAAGHYLWLESRGNPVVSASEDILGGIISSRDVTARKRAEAAIQFRLAFEQLIASLSTRFLNLPTDEIDAALNSALQEIGEFFRVDRSYIF